MDMNRYIRRIRALEGPLLPVAERLIKRRWLKSGLAVYRLDKLLFRLGLLGSVR